MSRRNTRGLLFALVALGILVRLYQVNAPLFEHHYFRQHDTAAIARNFYEEGMNPLYPRVDWRGNSQGYVETNFPIFSYSVAVLYGAFGPHEWLGRLVNIAIFALSALLLFRFARRLFDPRGALVAVALYAVVPISFVFSRTFQPDALMTFCALAGVYCFWVWTEENKWYFLVLSAVAMALAVLIKPYALYVGLPLAYLCHRRFGWSFLRRIELWGYAAAVILPAALWYIHAFHLWEISGNTFGVFAGQVKQGIPSPTDSIWVRLAKRLAMRGVYLMTTPPGVLLLLAGVLVRPGSGNYLLHWWGAAFVISIPLLPRGYFGHDYYLLPAVFVFVGFMAAGAVRIWDGRKIPGGVLGLSCLILAGFSLWQANLLGLIQDWEWELYGFGERYFHLFYTAALVGFAGLYYWKKRPSARAFVAATFPLMFLFGVWQWATHLEIPQDLRDRITFGERVRSLTVPGSKIIFVHPRFAQWTPDWLQHRTANGEYLYCDPVDFYHSHRKGWSLDEVLATPEFVETLRTRGAGYFATFFTEILVNHPDLAAALERNYERVEVTPQWAVYRLRPPIRRSD